MTQSTVIELTEYQPRTLPHSDLPLPLARQLQQQYGPQVRVERQWAAPGEPWRLTAQGWVGHLPLSSGLTLLLQPKTPLKNLFGMLEVAYRQPFRVLPGVVQAQSLPDFFERLAHILANRVLHRARQGVQRAYVGHVDRLPTVRGRLLLHPAPRPGEVNLPCAFEEHTADTEDNRILLYTLWLLSRAVQQPHVRRAVEQAYRALPGQVTLEPQPATVCLNRRYHRLNEDYRPMHALCYFFLDRLGPAQRPGQRPMLPFLVDMAQLFEAFVAEWLRAHLPPHLRLRVQAPVNNPDVEARVDLVLVDAVTGQVRYVLDTKYKAPINGKPSEKDIYQVVAYAQDRHCPEAVLIYPAALSQPLDTYWGDSVRVRSLTFALDGNLEAAGLTFFKELLG